MVASEPGNPKWRLEAVYAKENIGIVLYYQRRFTEAAGELDAAFRMMETLASKDPGNAEYPRELSNILAWLGDARRDEGRLELAIAAREQQIALLRQRLSADQTNVQLKQQLIPAQQALGILLADTGRLKLAVDQLRSAIADAENVTAIEPNNATWRGYAAGAHLELAGTLLSLRDTSGAAQEARAGCRLAAVLHERDPNVASWHTLQTHCHMARTKLALAEGSLANALELAERARESARRERGVDPVKDRYGVASSYRLIGDIRRRIGDGQEARQAWTAGLAQLPSNVVERPREMDERAALLERLGRRDEARPLSERLRIIGYRSTR